MKVGFIFSESTFIADKIQSKARSETSKCREDLYSIIYCDFAAHHYAKPTSYDAPI